MSEKIRDIDKNDVDISQLFKWSKEIEIEDAFSGMKVKFYMRLLGDADLGRARANAYRKSSALRKKLKDRNSDERTSLLAEMEDFNDIELIMKSIELLRISDIYQQAIKNISISEPREPSGDKLEEWEEHQDEVDEYPIKFKESVEKEADRLRKIDTNILKEKSKEELYRIYESEVINKLCQEEMNNGFYDMCIFFATFKDNKFKVPAFRDIENYENVHPTLKEKLKESYRSLELGIDVLKK